MGKLCNYVELEQQQQVGDIGEQREHWYSLLAGSRILLAVHKWLPVWTARYTRSAGKKAQQRPVNGSMVIT